MPGMRDSPGPARPRYRVAIVGAGPAGCACALALAQRGVSGIVLIEAGDHTQFRIGESLPPDAFRLFQALGIDQAFLADGHEACYGSCSYWGSGKRGYNDTLLNPLGHGWHLDRGKFNRLLAAQARARGAELLLHTSLAASMPASGGGYMLQLALQTPGGQGGQRVPGVQGIQGVQAVRGAPALPERAVIHADFVVDASGARGVFARQRGSRRRSQLPLVCLAARFTLPDGASGRSRLTHLEGVEHGWWYGAPLPDQSLLLAFSSDAATVKQRRLQHAGRWMAQLSEAVHTAELARGAVPMADRILSFPAPSFCLDRLCGPDWLAIGDAASAYDPITSQGIAKAIANGIAAAAAVAAPAAALDYARSVERQYQHYLQLRRQYYGWERRWPDAPFWRRFHRSGEPEPYAVTGMQADAR